MAMTRGRRAGSTVAPLGDRAVLLTVADALDLDANAVARRVAMDIRSRGLGWVVDVVPALVTVAVQFDASTAREAAERRAALERLLLDAAAQDGGAAPLPARTVSIPVCYEAPFAPDLKDVAHRTGLAPNEVVALHAGAAHSVLMIGFAPGQPYLGGLDARLSVPRRASPRLRVEAGSVAIANAQTVDLSVRDPGRLERDRPDAARAVRSGARAAVSARAGGHGRVRAHHPRGVRARRDAPAGDMSLQVLRSGALATVQDLGRPGLQHLGIVPGGAMDPLSHRIANALVGNGPEAATLEIALAGPELTVTQDALVALHGARFEAAVDGAPLPHSRPVLVRAGARLRIGRAETGCFGYLAVAGGLAVPPVLGSRSTYLSGRFGGWRGRLVERDAVLPFEPDAERLVGGAVRARGAPAPGRGPRPRRERRVVRAGVNADRARVTGREGSGGPARGALR